MLQSINSPPCPIAFRNRYKCLIIMSEPHCKDYDIHVLDCSQNCRTVFLRCENQPTY